MQRYDANELVILRSVMARCWWKSVNEWIEFCPLI